MNQLALFSLLFWEFAYERVTSTNSALECLPVEAEALGCGLEIEDLARPIMNDLGKN